jgi:hypothetical protein
MFAIKKELISTTAVQSPSALTWKEAVDACPEICGGKGYNLGRLDRYGFRIPRGGVIPAPWYRELLAQVPEDTLAFVERVPAEQVIEPAVTDALDEIRHAIESLEPPAVFMEGLEGAGARRRLRFNSLQRHNGRRCTSVFCRYHRSF